MGNELLFRIPLGTWSKKAVDWLTANLKALFDFISDTLLTPIYSFLENFLTTPDLLSLGVAFTVVMLAWKGWKAGAATAVGFLIGWAIYRFVENPQHLGWNPIIVAVVLVAVTAVAYFARGRNLAYAVGGASVLGFAISQWVLVDEELPFGIVSGMDSIPGWTIMVLLVLVAYATKGWKLALAAIIGFLIIYGVDQWENAMSSFALVLVASIIAVVLGVPIGILAAKNRWVSAVTRPILDFLQTMPAFVYLIPFVVLFGIGVVPGIVATILFSIAPAVRFTELGIKQVDKEVVEAAHAFGAHPFRILTQIQLPLARPTIMGGVNQVIMLALSMVVIAGMVGAGGLGQDVYTSVTQVNISLGAESGLAVVILAIYLDRVTGAFGTTKQKLK